MELKVKIVTERVYSFCDLMVFQLFYLNGTDIRIIVSKHFCIYTDPSDFCFLCSVVYARSLTNVRIKQYSLTKSIIIINNYSYSYRS